MNLALGSRSYRYRISSLLINVVITRNFSTRNLGTSIANHIRLAAFKIIENPIQRRKKNNRRLQELPLTST